MFDRKGVLVAGVVVVVALVFAVPVWAQGFTDDFESYAPGTTLGAPWADWGTGAPPVTATVNAAGGVGNSQCMSIASGEPVRWFTNPLDVQHRYVDVEFSWRGSTANEDVAFFIGYSNVAPGTGRAGTGGFRSQYYGLNIGVISINGPLGSTPWGSAGTVTLESKIKASHAWDYSDSQPLILDGVTWNTIRVRCQRLSATEVRGQSQLWVNGVSSGTWNVGMEATGAGWQLFADSNDPNPQTPGLNLVDFYYYYSIGGGIDNFNIVQSGFAIPGDANHDVTVNDSDLNLMLTGWSTGATPGLYWQDGDFNDDALVDDSDLNLLLTNWTYPPAGSVPEPTTIGLLAFGAIALVRRRRRA